MTGKHSHLLLLAQGLTGWEGYTGSGQHSGGVHWLFHQDSVDRAPPSQIMEVDVIIVITSSDDEC